MSNPSQTTPPSRSNGQPLDARPEWVWGFFLIVGTLLVYHQVWRAGFIWDDDAHLTKNPCIVGPLGFAGIWTTSAATYYPLTLTNFWIQHALWGLDPAPYHLVNVLVHATCGVALWRVLRTLAIPAAWFGAALWVLHPVQVESAAWITELKNTQSCFFYLLAILFFEKWQRVRGGAGREYRFYYAAALLCAACAILSKSSTVMLPVILALCWWWKERTWRWSNLWALTPFLILSLVASGWTIWEQKYHSGALGPEWTYGLAERAIIAGKVVWFYLGKLFWPDPIIFIYPRWPIDASRSFAYIPLMALVAGMLGLWHYRERWARSIFFAAAYFVASLIPVLGFFNVYFFRYSFVGDHLQYLASIGPLALAAGAIATGVNALGDIKRILWPAVAGALLLTLGFLSWRQTAIYANEEKLWRTTAAQNPSAWIAHNNLGRLDRPEKAIGHYAKAIELNPSFAEGHNNLATAFMQTGRVEEALAEFPRALELDPLYADAYFNFGNALLELGRLTEAIPHYQQGLRIKPEDAEAHYNLGVALLGIGRGDEAISHFQRALELNPADFAAGSNLAWILATHPDPSLRDGKKAVELAERAHASSAGLNLYASVALAAAYAEVGRFPDAIRAAEQALQAAAGPDDRKIAEVLRAQLALYRAGSPSRDRTQSHR